MSMKMGTRIIFTVFILVVVAFCVFLLGTLFGAIDSGILSNMSGVLTSGGELGYQFLAAVILIAMIVVGILLVFFGMFKKSQKTATVAMLENGNILITVKAVEDLIDRYMKEEKQIRGTHITVTPYGESIDISLEVSVTQEADIPALTNELQNGLTEYVHKHTGLAVKKNEIVVMSVVEDKEKARALAREAKDKELKEADEPDNEV